MVQPPGRLPQAGSLQAGDALAEQVGRGGVGSEQAAPAPQLGVVTAAGGYEQCPSGYYCIFDTWNRTSRSWEMYDLTKYRDGRRRWSPGARQSLEGTVNLNNFASSPRAA
ncbi:hypothetical protein [Streptomyces sp. ME19-01-6]|uniref:hypothetical protein n=1 Tax=Streptomyces sp. ME19-01-6 TaxID=3028686 RepID=UPI0029A314EC|nr:hypothetical protein [Streptomyces sp. ME19-01-6]MDX3227621.1 hypothetical protein [Streptomyces sp. ME19-01-6]